MHEVTAVKARSANILDTVAKWLYVYWILEVSLWFVDRKRYKLLSLENFIFSGKYDCVRYQSNKWESC